MIYRNVYIFIVTLLSLNVLGDVTCAWNGNNYECSGEGNRVIVSGGGVIQLPPVITNVVGVCTNCSAISPSELEDTANWIRHYALAIGDYALQTKDLVESERVRANNLLSDINTYRTFVANDTSTATNYMRTVDNGQAQAMLANYNNSGNSTLYKNRSVPEVGNGIYYYANTTVKPGLQQTIQNCNQQIQYLDDIGDAVAHIASHPHSDLPDYSPTLVDKLLEGAQECQMVPSGSGGGGSGGSVTNNMTGNWCTYEQGEALKSLLGHISNEVYSVSVNTIAISNFTEQCAYNIRTGLFTEYNAIPRQAQLGDTWQNVYLDGNETNWGYQPTNILARIELLLYGMSGVSTNDTPFSEGETESTEVLDGIDETTDDVVSQIEAISTDADGTAAQSLGQALISFFGEFSISGDQYSEGTELWPSSYFRVGSNEYYVPQFTPGGGAQFLNQMQSFSRIFFTVGYFVFGAFLVFRFWAWFAEKAVAMSKWVVELLTSLFAS